MLLGISAAGSREIDVEEPPDLQLKYPKLIEKLHKLRNLVDTRMPFLVAFQKLGFVADDLPEITNFLIDYRKLEDLKNALYIPDREVRTPPALTYHYQTFQSINAPPSGKIINIPVKKQEGCCKCTIL